MLEDNEVPTAELDPGIREVVRWLNRAGFKTIDSGDGVTKFKDGEPVEGVLDVPHVFIRCEPLDLISEAEALEALLGCWGINVEPIGRGDVNIQASYDPSDRTAVVQLFGLNDERLMSALKEPA